MRLSARHCVCVVKILRLRRGKDITNMDIRMTCIKELFTLCYLCLLSSGAPQGKSSSSEEITRCPLSCVCSPDPNTATLEVTCSDKRFWSEMPMPPSNTTYMSVVGGNMPVVRRNIHRSPGQETLRKLELRKSNISQIEPTSLQGMKDLQVLLFPVNMIQSLQNGTFIYNINLVHLSFEGNQFTRIPWENVCLLKKLQILNMTLNAMRSAKFEQCFSRLRNLTSIDISRNPIGKIDPSDFNALRNSPIMELNLKLTVLTTISAKVLKIFPHLRVLNLQYNRITSLDTNLFQGTPKILFLFLGGNRFHTIPDKALSRLQFLQRLDLQRNYIVNNVLGLEFQNFKNLSVFAFTSNPLSSLAKNSFSALKYPVKLKELYLMSCKLTTIHPDAFTPLQSLTTIDLTKNYLTATVLKQALFGLSKAHSLHSALLGYNNLRGLDKETFKYLANVPIKSLLLRGCNLTTLQTDTFQYLPNLKMIYLRDNYLTEIQPNAFRHITQLMKLDLRYNLLVTPPDADKVKLGNLWCLRLEHNAIGKIHKLTPGSFKGYKQLQELNLLNNNIQSIGDGVFSPLIKLLKLTLSHNGIISISSNGFAGLNNLQYLDLQNNVIDTISVNVFEQTPNLQNLDLSYNSYLTALIEADIAPLLRPLKNINVLQLKDTGLQRPPVSAFYNLTNLTVLGLSSNGITWLDTNLLRDQKNLRVLTLKKNNIGSLSGDLLNHLTHLEQLDVSDNSFHCGCDILPFTNWIKSGQVYMPNLHAVTCKSPARRINTRLEDLYLEQDCMSFTFYYIYWTTMLCYFLTLTFATTAYRFRWYFRYWRHLVRARKAMEREIGEERYVFDAFVSYTHQDSRWVVHELLKELEYKAKIRLCLHKRNWLVGRTIPRNIVDSIEKSRKTVLVLSNAYAQSKWCDFELSMVLNKVLSQHRDVVVPILLEPICKRHVTEQMVHLFTTQTYIKWPQRNERKQRRFWRKLIKTLRPPNESVEYDEDARDFLTEEVNVVRPGYRRNR